MTTERVEITAVPVEDGQFVGRMELIGHPAQSAIDVLRAECNRLRDRVAELERENQALRERQA